MDVWEVESMLNTEARIYHYKLMYKQRDGLYSNMQYMWLVGVWFLAVFTNGILENHFLSAPWAITLMWLLFVSSIALFLYQILKVISYKQMKKRCDELHRAEQKNFSEQRLYVLLWTFSCLVSPVLFIILVSLVVAGVHWIVNNTTNDK